MRRSPLIPLLLVGGLLTTACGARVDDELRQRAAAAALSTGGGGGGAVDEDGTALGEFDDGTSTDAGIDGTTTDPTGGDAGSGDAGSDGAAGDGGSGGAGSSDSGSGGGGGGGGGGGTAPAPAGGNGGATDVGVTANSLTIGTVADLSGPVPGLFEGAVIGTQAYVAKVNSEGGVFGRKLVVKVKDSQLDCGANKAAHQSLSKDAFAFVGSFSLFDDCGSDVLNNSGIPDVHEALGTKAQKLANNFSPAPLPIGWRTGPLAYYKKTYGAKFTKIGSIFAEAGGGAALWGGTRAAIEANGGKVIYQRGFKPTDTDFTADIVRMRNDGVQMVYIVASDAPTFARILRAARSQNVDWPIVAGGIAYDEGFLKSAGKDAEGVINDQQYTLFFNQDEAARIPVVKEFQLWTGRVAPGKKRDLFGAYGWSSADLFVRALKAAGPKAQRADVLRELKKITKFDAGGLIAPSNPAQKKPATCWVLTEVKGGKFVRINTPPTSYRCDGGYFFK